MQKINVYPEVISWRKSKDGQVFVSVRIDFENNRAATEKISHKIKLQDWDSEKRCVRSTCKNSTLINQLVENKVNSYKNYFLKRELMQLPITKDLIKQFVKSGGAVDSFYSYAKNVIDTKKLKDGGELNQESKRRYLDELSRIMIFRSELSFHQLTLSFLQDYKHWLQNVYTKKDGTRLHKNSVWKAFAFMRMIYNEAIKEEMILPDNNPFKKFQVGTFEQDLGKIKYLGLAEIERIEDILKSKNQILEPLTVSVGWRFLAMCVSGIRISDAMNFDDLMFNDAGNLELIPHKTRRHGNKAYIPVISGRQRTYLNMALEHKLPKQDAKIFRKTFNDHLKIICAMAGIRAVTSHAGRHTMGSFLVDAGVQEKAAMTMLGVKSEKVIRTYLHLKESKLQVEALKLKNVF